MAQTKKSPRSTQPSRREFLKTLAVLAGATLGSMPYLNLHAQDTARKFKAALIGCGGRGNGAANDHLEAVKYLNDKLGWNLQVQFVATGDWFKGRAEEAGKRYGVPKEQCFGGADCYKKVLEAAPDVVLMAQPPAFRPLHFEAVIQAGKHVFFEKPSAVDPPGVRRVIKAGEAAKQKGLCVVAGTQRRHEKGYNDGARAIKDGVRGRVVAGRVAWNMGAIFTNTPINAKSPDDLVGPWNIWVEMSGDHICEQHVHNLDIANWYVGSHPISAGGFGFRARRKAGNMYDHFSVDLEYPKNVHIHSMCRQIADCWDWVGEDFVYERGRPAACSAAKQGSVRGSRIPSQPVCGRARPFALCDRQGPAAQRGLQRGHVHRHGDPRPRVGLHRQADHLGGDVRRPQRQVLQAPVEAHRRGFRDRRAGPAQGRRHPHSGRAGMTLEWRRRRMP